MNNKIRDDLKSNSEQSNEGKNNNIVIKKNVEFDANFNNLVERANKIFKAYYKEDEENRKIFAETKNIEQDFDRNEIFEGKNIEEFLVYKIINMAEYLYAFDKGAYIYGVKFQIRPSWDNGFKIEFTIRNPEFEHPLYIRKTIKIKNANSYEQNMKIVDNVNEFFSKNFSKHLNIEYLDNYGNCVESTTKNIVFVPLIKGEVLQNDL